MDVSVIIVNYNSGDYIEECLCSIYENTKNVEFEIIVVDNASSDGSIEKIERKFPDIICIRLSKNIGFGSANNVGANIAKGVCLFFLNPDTIIINNSIGILYDYLKCNCNVALCGGNLYKENLEPNRSYSLSIVKPLDALLSAFNVNRGKADEYFNKSDKAKSVAWIVGADIMIRRDVFEEIGQFDIEFFMYKEELDISMRIYPKYEIHSVPTAKIIHKEGGCSESKEFDRETHFIYLDSEIRFVKKYYYGYFFVISFLYILKSIFGYLLYFLLNNKRKKKYWLRNLKTVIGTFQPQRNTIL